MRCPFCGHEESVVKDSRPSDDGTAIRRRRSCPSCGGRFTTFERIQLRELTVIKHDGRKEAFERDKLSRSFRVALRRREVAEAQMDKAINGIVRQLESSGEVEVTTDLIGELAMQALIHIDAVGYVRYASVYKNFSHAQDFNAFIEELQKAQKSLTISNETL